MPQCDDLSYVLGTVFLIWGACMLWAVIAVWEWHQAKKLDREYQGLLDSLLNHLKREHVRVR